MASNSQKSLNFAPANNFLRGDAVVFEPHSFRIAVNAQHQGKQYRFTYDQIEYRIDMSEEQMKQSGIELATAGPARIKSSIELIGEIQLNRDNTVRVVPRLSGIVESAPVNAGDKVKKGQTLAVFDQQTVNADLAQARAGVAEAQALFDQGLLLGNAQLGRHAIAASRCLGIGLCQSLLLKLLQTLC